MKNVQDKFGEVLLKTFVSVFWCALFGSLLWLGSGYAGNRSAGYYFIRLEIAFGIIGSVFFYSLRYGLRNALGGTVLVAFCISVLFLHSHGMASVRDAVITASSAGVLYLYRKYFYRQRRNMRMLEPLVVALLFGAANFLMTFFLVASYGMGLRYMKLTWVNEVFQQWFLLGLGIGIGIILTERPYSLKISLWFRNLFNPTPRNNGEEAEEHVV